MNALKSFQYLSSNQRHKKVFSRGGGPMPHHDPPDFKPTPNRRIYGFADHHLWINSGYTREYYVNKKHLYYRGLSGMFMGISRIYIFGLIVPAAIICLLKSASHDAYGYYNTEINICDGPAKCDGNMKETLALVRHCYSESNDFLSRRSGEFYKVNGSIKRDLGYQTYSDVIISKL